MFIIRLIVFLVINTILFSNSIEYNLTIDKTDIIGNHFLSDNSNAVKISILLE